MSIAKNGIKRRHFLAVVMSTAWLVGCCTAWQNSRLSGGNQSEKAAQIVKDLSHQTVLTPACFMLAKSLAEAALKARAATWLPTTGMLSRNEDVAAEHYELGRCPVAAFTGISFGVAEVAHDAEYLRIKNRRARW